MTIPLKNFPEAERKIIINRRLANKSGGLGYWSALEAKSHLTNRPIYDIIRSELNNESKEE